MKQKRRAIIQRYLSYFKNKRKNKGFRTLFQGCSTSFFFIGLLQQKIVKKQYTTLEKAPTGADQSFLRRLHQLKTTTIKAYRNKKTLSKFIKNKFPPRLSRIAHLITSFNKQHNEVLNSKKIPIIKF